MKFALFFILIFSSLAQAQNICQYREASQFSKALNQNGIKILKVSKTASRFTFREKKMIHLAVSLNSNLHGVMDKEAYELFSATGGKVSYLSMYGENFALVEYSVAGKKFGGFFRLHDRAYTLLAGIDHGMIDCL
jgi:hypothetical protein